MDLLLIILPCESLAMIRTRTNYTREIQLRLEECRYFVEFPLTFSVQRFIYFLLFRISAVEKKVFAQNK